MASKKVALSKQADDMQLRTRKERDFDREEADLPSLTQHTSFKLLNPLTAKAAAGSKLTDILSYLGSRNPRPLPITSTDAVWLLDNVAYRGPKGKWQAEFVAAAFTQHPTQTVFDVVGSIAEKIGVPNGDAAFDTIEERAIPFLQDILPGRQVQVTHGAGTKLTLGPGGRNGISSDVRELPDAPDGATVTTVANVPAGAAGVLKMKTFFAEPEGWAVVSDVDDTIKITQTSDPIGILRSTFLDKPTPITGMPELYKFLHTYLPSTSPWFYLSASPYNLYPFLSQFRDQYFPPGQLILRDASWMSIPGLLSNLTLRTEEYKTDRIEKLHTWLPRRKMILIGDSTQSDPEAYGDICRAFPGWVKLVLIRKVTDIAAVGIEAKNEPKRFEKAFEDVPKNIWHVFEDPQECYAPIQALSL